MLVCCLVKAIAMDSGCQLIVMTHTHIYIYPFAHPYIHSVKCSLFFYYSLLYATLYSIYIYTLYTFFGEYITLFFYI